MAHKHVGVQQPQLTAMIKRCQHKNNLLSSNAMIWRPVTDGCQYKTPNAYLL